MTKAVRQMQEDLKLIDLVIELIDARIPYSARNPQMDQLAQGKGRLLLLNKSDLADPQQNALWIDYYQNTRNCFACAIDARNKKSIAKASALIDQAAAKKKQKDLSRGIKNRPVRAMVVGIPNAGKSTFINTFAGKSAAKTGNRPGVTRGKQWIRLNKSVELLDTPGILWPKFDDQTIGLHLAAVGSIRDEVLSIEELACDTISEIRRLYPGRIADFYSVDEDGKPFEILDSIALCRKCLKVKGETDAKRAAGIFLDDFRTGRLGKLTLDRIEDFSPKNATSSKQGE